MRWQKYWCVFQAAAVSGLECSVACISDMALALHSWAGQHPLPYEQNHGRVKFTPRYEIAWRPWMGQICRRWVSCFQGEYGGMPGGIVRLNVIEAVLHRAEH